MSTYLTNISPDSFSGIIFAFEGISRCVVLINGPTGCKYYHSSVSDDQMIRQTEFDPLKFPEKWYFGQPRVPCSYLDNSDYVFGSTDKLVETLTYIRDNVKFDLLCIVNSPGAALIGDDLAGIAGRVVADKPVVAVETPGFSSDVCKGYETAVLRLIDEVVLPFVDGESSGEVPATPTKSSGEATSNAKLGLNPAFEPAPRSVNILGMSLFHRNCTGDVIELKHLMELCGIEVNCVLCADCDNESIKKLPDAALNIVIHPEYAGETAKHLHKLFSTPYYVCDGPPIGFGATETFINDICSRLGADSSRFTEYCERARARAYSFVSRINSLRGLPRGMTFAVEGTYSEIYAYTSFLVRYFGMIPVCASVLNPDSDCFREKLCELYDEFGVADTLGQDIMETAGDLVLASWNTLAGLRLRGHTFWGIETALPTLGYVDVVPKTHLGVQGALMLVELVINGVPS